MRTLQPGFWILALAALTACATPPARQHATTLPVMLAQQTRQEPAATMSDAELEAILSEEDEEIAVSDPLEMFNRAMFWFNDKLYVAVLSPAARGWRAILPKPWRVHLGNVFANLNAPVHIVNAALQGKGRR